MAREVFGMGNEFAQKITYSVQHPDKLLAAFRNSPELRIAVTVDLIATGTDVRPLECVFFLRDVKSWAYFEQMKGRGARTLDPAELNTVTPDVLAKERFVIVDAVGVTECAEGRRRPLQLHSERQISLEKLLSKAGNLTISLAETSTLCSAARPAEPRSHPAERAELEQIAGAPLSDVVGSLGRVADDDELAALPVGRPRRRARPGRSGSPAARREPRAARSAAGDPPRPRHHLQQGQSRRPARGTQRRRRRTCPRSSYLLRAYMRDTRTRSPRSTPPTGMAMAAVPSTPAQGTRRSIAAHRTSGPPTCCGTPTAAGNRRSTPASTTAQST